MSDPMTTYDAERAECLVFTYKDGLLSAVAHDLKIRVTELSIDVDWDAPSITATFDPTSLRVVTPMKDGREAPSLLGDRDKKKIEKNIVEDVLHAKKHREIRFASKSIEREGDRARVTGELTLHGTTRELALEARKVSETWVAEARLHKPDFGIEPYTAAFGTLRLEPHVDVTIRLPQG
ncbi:MAG: YceI family protein [Myxococcota bacterium]